MVALALLSLYICIYFETNAGVILSNMLMDSTTLGTLGVTVKLSIILAGVGSRYLSTLVTVYFEVENRRLDA